MLIIDALAKYGRYLSSKPRTHDIELIVVHSTAGTSFLGAWQTLIGKGFGYHAILPDENEFGHGGVVKCVPDGRVCGHAGNSYGPLEELKGISRVQGPGSNFVAKTSVNGYSLGVSFVNANDGVDKYSEQQHQACVDRCVSWCLAYPSIKWISTHYWVSPRRKTDPKGYDMERLLFDVNVLLSAKGRTGVKLWKS